MLSVLADWLKHDVRGSVDIAEVLRSVCWLAGGLLVFFWAREITDVVQNLRTTPSPPSPLPAPLTTNQDGVWSVKFPHRVDGEGSVDYEPVTHWFCSRHSEAFVRGDEGYNSGIGELPHDIPLLTLYCPGGTSGEEHIVRYGGDRTDGFWHSVAVAEDRLSVAVWLWRKEHATETTASPNAV